MFQIRVHGRGGQGVVTAAELLSIAAFLEGKHAQAFPSFGSERMGAPVMSFCRIDDKAIRSREPVGEPDALIIQDPTLLHQVDLFSGLNRDGFLLVNSTQTLSELGILDYASGFPPAHVCVVPATPVAMEHIGRPLPNVPLLGGFAAITGQVSITSLEKALGEKFSGKIAAANIAAVQATYNIVQKRVEEGVPGHVAAD